MALTKFAQKALAKARFLHQNGMPAKNAREKAILEYPRVQRANLWAVITVAMVERQGRHGPEKPPISQRGARGNEFRQQKMLSQSDR